MINLKRSLTSFLRSDNKLLTYIIGGLILVAAVIIFRCERQRSIDTEIKLHEKRRETEMLNDSIKRMNTSFDSILKVNEMIKIERDGVIVENVLLRDTLHAMRPVINNMSKRELRNLWTGYQGRHNLRHAR